MPLELHTGAADFAPRFAAFLNDKRETEPDVARTVADIIAAVRARDDDAVIEYTDAFDRVSLTADEMRLTRGEIAAGAGAADEAAVAALRFAADRIENFHRRQVPEDVRFHDDAGNELGYRWTALDAAGLYVPGGLASYPSSVLMNAIPARVAGVRRIAMVVPAPDGQLNPLVLAAAAIAGIDEIYRIGGAQAVAALAYGTATIAPVDKIVGPGNAYVAEAKRQVFGAVGIDMIAGPSEILVLADAANDPAWVAADLLSQAEHDTAAQAILMTDDADFAAAVRTALDVHLSTLEKHSPAHESWQRYGAVIVVADLAAEAPALIDAIAPEHLELAVADADAIAARVRHAGAIFLGRETPEAIGDYVAGPNHVLPTARRARFSSGLSVFDFLKRTSLIRCSAAGLAEIGPAAVTLAEAEGLPAHALSVALRLRPRP